MEEEVVVGVAGDDVTVVEVEDDVLEVEVETAEEAVVVAGLVVPGVVWGRFKGLKNKKLFKLYKEKK